AFRQLMLSAQAEKARPQYSLGFVSQAEAEPLLAYWSRGRAALVRHYSGPDGETTLPAHLDPMPELNALISSNPTVDVQAGLLDVAVRLKPPGAFIPDPRRLLFIDCELTYRDDSLNGREAVTHLEVLNGAANAAQISTGLRLINVPQRGDPVRLRV